MLRILEILVEGVILYLLYKFVVHFVIPVYKSTKRVRKQMKEMQDKMTQRMNNPSQPHTTENPAYRPDSQPYVKKRREEQEGEYIDYEEVK